MIKISITLLFFCSFLFANSSILVLNSYHKGYEWSDSVLSGIESELYPNTHIDMDILYMDSKRITSKEYFLKLKELYKVQLANKKYDLIIAIDRFAYDFTLENYKELFTDEHILAVGIENFSEKNLEKYALQGKVSALLEKRDLKGNVKLIQKLMPAIRKLYIINDKSLNAEHTEPLIQELIKDFKGRYQLIYTKEDNLVQLSSIFSKFEESSAVLFVRFYKNSDGSLNKNTEIAKFIYDAKVPIFVTDSIFIKKGAIGGKIIDLKKFGKNSGQMALEVLKTKQSSIKTFDGFTHVFDSKKLDQFNLSIIQVSEPFKVINKRLTFFDKYRGFINIVFMISPLLVLFIIALAHNIYLRKKEKELEDEKEKNRQFIIQQSKLAEVGEIFSSIAHQWKAPLVEITTIAQESFYSTSTNQKENESYVKDIMKQVDYMNDTINDFQNFIIPSKKKRRFNAKEAIDSMLDIVSHNIKYNYIQIDMTIKEGTNLNVFGFKNEFMQSILNIINNAKDELLKNDLKDRKIDIYFYNEKKNLIIEIIDNAGGIKAENIEKVFEPYYSTKEKGHGIGLYMAKMIIEDKMDGKISVENINTGAAFKVQIGCVK